MLQHYKNQFTSVFSSHQAQFFPESKSMASAPKSTMTFIKLLVLVFEFATGIKLPGLLVKMFKEMIPKLCTLRSHTGKSCEVSIERNINHYFFRQGWDKFLKENELQEGDVLVFNLVDETTFEVFAYGATCCLKEPQIQIQIPTSESENIYSKPEVSARITECCNAKRKDPETIFGDSATEYGVAKRGRKEIKERDSEKPVTKEKKSELIPVFS